MNKALLSLCATSALICANVVGAQTLIGTVTNQTGDTNAYYEFAKSTTSLGFVATSNGHGVGNIATVPISFQFNIAVPQFPTKIQLASLYFAASASTPAVDNGLAIVQAVNGATITVFVSTADKTYGAQYGNQAIFVANLGSGTVSQTYSPTLGTTTYSFNSTSNSLTYTSPYVKTSGFMNGAFSFNTTLAIGGKNQEISDFQATGSGQFFAQNASAVVPEPSAVAFLMGTGVAGSLFLIRRKRK